MVSIMSDEPDASKMIDAAGIGATSIHRERRQLAKLKRREELVGLQEVIERHNKRFRNGLWQS